MNDSLAQFKGTYITECLELLAQMEVDLLELDENSDKEKLNAIFRCAHSIKGGAGAFGLTAIAGFTHILEALLDKLREGEFAVSRELTDILLKARDVVFNMVSAARDGENFPENYGDDIKAELEKMVAGGASAPAVKSAQLEEKLTQISAQKYIIKFVPYPSLLATGNEPLLLLRELKSLGDAKIICNIKKLPNFAEVQPEICHLSWEISLQTDKSEEAIREVFEFVDGDCELVITSCHPEQAEGAVKELVNTEKDPSVAKLPQDDKNWDGKDRRAEPRTSSSASTTSIRVDIEKVDRLINMVGEIVIIQAMLDMQRRFLPVQQYPELMRGIDELNQHTRELQEAVMAVRMQPVKSIFSRMPRIVRDLSAQLGKDIRMETAGENTEVDKTIIEQLSDPLTHMIRNSVDHGIETPQIRREKGKPEQGMILLSAEHRGGKIVISISDDGAGINREKVLAKAREKGVVAPDAQLSDNEIDMLIFAAGFSTAEAVTSVSGRGVGMDVVKRNIEAIGGTVAVHNSPNKGSKFVIALPLTLAILDGMVVRVASEHYIVPIASIIETLRPKPEEVRNVADGSVVINVRGEFVPVFYLHKLFHISGAEGDASKALVVLVENNNSVIGLVVDELVGQQQVVIKSLEENADPVEGVSGATILGDGKVSLILDIPSLCHMKDENNKLKAA